MSLSAKIIENKLQFREFGEVCKSCKGNKPITPEATLAPCYIVVGHFPYKQSIFCVFSDEKPMLLGDNHGQA